MDGLRAFMGSAAADMTDNDLRVSLARLGSEHWSDASEREVETRVRAFVSALGRAEVVGRTTGRRSGSRSGRARLPAARLQQTDDSPTLARAARPRRCPVPSCGTVGDSLRRLEAQDCPCRPQIAHECRSFRVGAATTVSRSPTSRPSCTRHRECCLSSWLSRKGLGGSSPSLRVFASIARAERCPGALRQSRPRGCACAA